ncbi:MAG: hypothetical protein RQ966_15090 [Acetobacteraceae bacterium]|nr:hypothetical protein [Acetobacteraceae bacterium]
MFKNDDPTTVATRPVQTPVVQPGYFTDGNSATAVPATVVRADWANTITDEILNVVAGAGLTPSKTDNTQLLAAVRALVAAGALGFTPVQQGGGASQGTNKVYLGWDGAALRAQVDATDLGRLAKVSDLAPYALASALAGYVTNAALAADLAGYVTNGALAADLANYVTTASVASKSFAVSGYATLASGLILQWGTANIPSGTVNSPVSLPIAFPNAGLWAGISYWSAPPTSGACGAQINGTSTILVGNSAAGGTSGCNFYAIGY